MSHAESVTEMLRRHQDRLVAAFEDQDGGARFRTARWTRDGLGGGRARILEGGRVFERAGVNVSLVAGDRVPSAVSRTRPQLADRGFRATGISMVLHPLNPYAPSFHANFRYFEIDGGEWWFGGGMDLTPMYGFDEDAVHFHRTVKEWCGRHEIACYEEWKATCDEYFYIKHRKEMRGIGGVFFDRIAADAPRPPAAYGAFVEDGLGAVLDAYQPIVARRAPMPYGDRERDWQLARRGRYAEFNLVYDRGTLFGLQTNANIEAVLMSMPPLARWGFDITPEPGSPESDVARFLQPRDWAAHKPSPLLPAR
ncbi:oxygen-dependent coproporphyrinogen oxidase [Actinomadura montaniterrae]|uniref:coproporphyrinogen oxidase n=1 Tax=Actinomadura montaniterrae TaxID=1803903 RepID=A0A6L3W0R1_9ACTN|nr:oxygen-dependent coproporphyrinogen oxidase [Actinomadura montaniterrae]KAB2382921.1 oxygen-dependent coproporphyrinogen oxidase [Actinomadura montaniterrae]